MSNRKVLVDMDGVITDFVRGCFRWFNRQDIDYGDITWNLEQYFGYKDNPGEFWEQLRYNFWRNLPWTPTGVELLNGVIELAGRENVIICSAPCRTHGCIDGKIDWLREHCPSIARQFMLTPKKEFAASPNRILLDDNDDNCAKFVQGGGVILTIPQPWNLHKCDLDSSWDYNVKSKLAVLERWLKGN